MSEERYETKDQAASLRRQVQKTKQKTEVDQLPPRREVHQGRKKTKVRWSLPFVRFFLVLFILFVILTLAFPVWRMWL
ncbi:hypothetical protein B0H94_10371 [Salsuginibacillus halophilus]|uniref:Uncharacterized protein n=1 Tax=Salsuginibacillus halophilus TaxID=517424 RepID=A0A2P8HW67_9BACI|nr:hypothetical protein [Salsuginibacillus halophilus]PSL50460.1 hypothetical protein B0H94_10371 [Salsuginibacillus halophilus]